MLIESFAAVYPCATFRSDSYTHKMDNFICFEVSTAYPDPWSKSDFPVGNLSPRSFPVLYHPLYQTVLPNGVTYKFWPLY